MKIVTKNVSCEFKCKFDRRKCNWNENWNIDKCRCECRKHRICEKDYILNPTTCSCKTVKYLGSIIYDSVITCDEIIDAEAKSHDEETKTVTTNFNEKNVICKAKNFNILLFFLLTTIMLLIFVCIYCYLIKYKSKQKHLLPYYVTNERFCINDIL